MLIPDTDSRITFRRLIALLVVYALIGAIAWFA